MPIKKILAYVESRPWVFLGALSACCLILSAGTAFFVLQRFPNSADEYDYLFHAQTFLQGRFWNAPHPKQEFFSFIWLSEKEGKWFSAYPPGWPLVLAASMLLRIPPWLVNPILGSFSLVVLFGLARRLYNTKIASLTVLSVLGSSFFLFNSASHFSHILCSLLLLLFVYFTVRWELEEKRRYLLLAGFFLGFAFITRYYTTLCFALPVLIFHLFKKRVRALKDSVFLALGLLSFFFFYLFYNHQITGHSFLDPATWVQPDQKMIGFIHGYTLQQALEDTHLHFIWLVHWASPFLIVIYFFYLILTLGRTIHFIPYLFLSVVVGHFFVPFNGGNQYGPRYYYEAYPFLVLWAVACLFGEKRIEKGRYTRQVLKILFWAGLLFSIASVPRWVRWEHQIVSERRDLYRLVEEQRIEDAIVFLEKGTGVLWPMPIGDLLRNGTDFQESVLFARDMGERNKELIPYFPNRKFYIYERKPDRVEGSLKDLKWE